MTIQNIHQDPSALKNPKSLVIMLHGYGADGADLISLAPLWQEDLPHTLFLAPDAPHAHEGGMGRQWFSLAQGLSLAAITTLLEESRPMLDAFIDKTLAQYKIPQEKLILGGFSQGAMLALHVGLRRQAIGGIMSFSGILAAPVPADAAKNAPVFITHGTKDPVIPFECLALAQKALAKAKIPHKTLPRDGLAHGIDMEGIKAGHEFIKENL